MTWCETVVQVNLMGQLWVLREFLPAMISMDRGSIIFMCGLPGHAGAPNMWVRTITNTADHVPCQAALLRL